MDDHTIGGFLCLRLHGEKPRCYQRDGQGDGLDPHERAPV